MWETWTRWTWWLPEWRCTPGGSQQGDNCRDLLDSPEYYAEFTPAKKQKHFQPLRAMKATRNSGKTNNSSATVAELTSAISAVSAAALANSELTAATTKHAAAECGETNDSDAIGEPEWGCDQKNPAVAGR
jgi:hypothetical protein